MKKQTQHIFAQMSFYEVCEHALEGSDTAWAYVCLVVQRRAQKMARSRSQDFGLTEEDALDAAQETVELFVRKGRALMQKSKDNGIVGAWLHRFVYDALTSAFRKQQRYRLVPYAEDNDESAAYRYHAIEDARNECDDIEKTVTVRSLRQIMLKTEEDAHIADALSMGMTYRQIASVCGLSLHSVLQSVTKMRARAQRFVERSEECLERVA